MLRFREILIYFDRIESWNVGFTRLTPDCGYLCSFVLSRTRSTLELELKHKNCVKEIGITRELLFIYIYISIIRISKKYDMVNLQNYCKKL